MNYILLFLFLLLTDTFVTSHVGDEASEKNDTLPQIFEISRYDLQFTVPLDVFTDDSNEFTGAVKIELSITDSEAENIFLHADSNYITLNNVNFNDTDLYPGDYSIDRNTDILTAKIYNPITVNTTYTLAINYTGRLNTKEMYGLYKSSYVDESNVTKYFVAAQFEPNHARKAFPCFDEPQYKAEFDAFITYPTNLTIIFNTKRTISIIDTELGITAMGFQTTPVMSTYLIAMVISEFTCTSGEAVDYVAFQVCSRAETASGRDLAVDVGTRIIDRLNMFTNFNYNKSVVKLDQVAFPEFPVEVAEKWGLVTYRESAILWNEEEFSNRFKQKIVTTIGNELAHFWFGDLVWSNLSDIFLTEGFASYLEYNIVDEVVTHDWELNKQIVIEHVHKALVVDASTTSHALQSDVYTPNESCDRLDKILYNKGGSIFRMVAHMLGLENFEAGIQKYLSDNAYSNVVSDDLWTALDGVTHSELPADTLNEVMENWITNAGFPLVTAKLNGRIVTLTQERFLYSGSDTTSKWYIPISYTISEEEDKFISTSPEVWLTPTDDINITLPDSSTWIILNNQQTGYYRVNYDGVLWNYIKAALESETFGGIEDLNRAQIVDDLFNIAKASKINFSVVIDTTNFLSTDTSYYPWHAAFTGYDFLLTMVGQNELREAVTNSLLKMLQKLYESVPISNINASDQIYTHKQVLTLTWACKLGNEDCIDEANKQFQEYKSTEVRPDKNLRTVVYCSGLRNSSDQTDWEFLRNAYPNSSNLPLEQDTIITALGCTKDTALLQRYLTETITDDSGIQPQHALLAYSSVYSSNSEGVTVAFDFLTQNYEAIVEKYQNADAPGTIIKGIAERLKTQEEADKLNDFINSNNLPEAFHNAAKEALQTAYFNVKWIQRYEEELEEIYGLIDIKPHTDGVGRFGASFTITLAVVFVRKLFIC